MYGAGMCELPFGIEIIRRAERGFVPEFGCKKFEMYRNAERILAFFIDKLQIKNCSTYRNGGEWIAATIPHCYKPDLVGEIWDGNGMFNHYIVIEIFGCGAHSNCAVHPHDPTDLHPMRRGEDGKKMTHGEVCLEDRKRLLELRKEWPDNTDFLVVQMCEFDRDFTKKTGKWHQEYSEFLKRHPEYNMQKCRRSEKEILDDILHSRIFGFVKADFHLSPELQKKTELFPLFFKRAMVSRDDVGPLMKTFLEQANLLKKPRSELISSHFGKQLLVSTSLCAFYLQIGATVTNVSLVIQYSRTTALKKMVEDCCELRYLASAKGPDEKTIGNLMKALIVSLYGRMGMSPKKLQCVRYLSSDGLLAELYKEQFQAIEYVGELGNSNSLYELRKKFPVLEYKSPIHCAAMILNFAKLHILKLVYDVLTPCFDPRSFTYFTSQTDSVSIVCAEGSMENWISKWILPGMREKFEELRKVYFVTPGDSEEAKRSVFRQGVYKLEWQATSALGISSKVYCAFNEKGDKVKLSCRSVPYSCGKFLHFKDFYSVLHENKPIKVSYQGFNFVDGQMYLEQMTKTAVTRFYIKRIVHENMTTSTLAL